MFDVAKKLEQENLLVSIEEDILSLESKFDTYHNAVAIANRFENNIKSNKEVVSQEDMPDDTLIIASENFEKDLRELGYKTVMEFESMEELIASQEEIGKDVWTAIKKLLEGIWKAISSMYGKIGKFLDLEKAKVDEDEETINALGDINAFDIPKNTIDQLLSKFSRKLPVFMLMGHNLTDPRHIKEYGEMVIGNQWILKEKDIFLKGLEQNKDGELTFNEELKELGKVSDKVFTNVNGILTRNYQSVVNAHMLASFSPNKATLLSIFKLDNVSAVKINDVTLTVDTANAYKNANSKLSKLDKDYLFNIIEVRKSLLGAEKEFEKEAKGFENFINKQYKKLAETGDMSQTVLSGNSKAVGNIIVNTANSLITHIKLFDTLTDDLVKVYKEAAKTAK